MLSSNDSKIIKHLQSAHNTALKFVDCSEHTPPLCTNMRFLFVSFYINEKCELQLNKYDRW